MSRWTREATVGGAGATGGTVLLVIIRALPDSTPGKNVAICLAPSVGVGLGLVARISIRLLDMRLRHRRIMRRFDEAIAQQRAVLHNPASTNPERSQSRSELARLGRQRMIYMRNRIQEDELADLRHMPMPALDDEEVG